MDDFLARGYTKLSGVLTFAAVVWMLVFSPPDVTFWGALLAAPVIFFVILLLLWPIYALALVPLTLIGGVWRTIKRRR